jgi:hypothetical protein
MFCSHEERDMEVIRLRLLNPAQQSNTKALKLSPQEIQVVAAHLRANVEEIVSLFGDDQTAVQQYISDCSVVDIDQADLARHHSTYYSHSQPRAQAESQVAAPVVSTKSVTSGNSMSTQSSHKSKLPAKTIFFKRGEPANTCILILSGKVEIVAGKEGFKLELGAWAVLGHEALICPEDAYIPDFSMALKSPKLRVLCMNRPAQANTRRGTRRLTLGASSSSSATATNWA